jgi:hypothetical protein
MLNPRHKNGISGCYRQCLRGRLMPGCFSIMKGQPERVLQNVNLWGVLDIKKDRRPVPPLLHGLFVQAKSRLHFCLQKFFQGLTDKLVVSLSGNVNAA